MSAPETNGKFGTSAVVAVVFFAACVGLVAAFVVVQRQKWIERQRQKGSAARVVFPPPQTSIEAWKEEMERQEAWESYVDISRLNEVEGNKLGMPLLS